MDVYTVPGMGSWHSYAGNADPGKSEKYLTLLINCSLKRTPCLRPPDFFSLSLVIFLRFRFTWFFSYLFGHSCLASFISAKSSSVSPLNILVPETSFPINSWATPFSPLASINIWVLMTYKCVSTARYCFLSLQEIKRSLDHFQFLRPSAH